MWVCVCGRGDMHVTPCTRGQVDNVGSQFSLARGTQAQTRAIWLGGKCFYPPIHLTGPEWCFQMWSSPGPEKRHRHMVMVIEVSQTGPLFSPRKLVWVMKKNGWGGNPSHHIRVDSNFLSVEYLTCYLHSCLSRINPCVLLRIKEKKIVCLLGARSRVGPVD